jgi:hypothetical protein
MATKKKWKGDRSKEKTIEVPRRAAPILKKRQDQLDSRKARNANKREDFSQAAARIVREATKE